MQETAVHALDIEQPEALRTYLRQIGRIEPAEQPKIHVLAGGVSNRTVLVEREGGDAWVLKQALRQLRVAAPWFSSPERIHREALGLRTLTTLAPTGAITPLIWEDWDHHLLAMSAVPTPHINWKTLLLAGLVDLDHVVQFGHLLGMIQRRAYEQRAQLAEQFTDRSFFESLRLEPYYSYTAAQVPAAREFLEALVAETRDTCLTLVHGDYSPKNILLYGGKLVLLDHEVIHWGDPAFDVGFGMTHLLSKAHHLRSQRAAFAYAARCFWMSYRQALGDLPWGIALEERAVRHTLACLLARVAGRSPLEYMDEEARARQQAAVVALLAAPPATIVGLVGQFVERISS